MEVKVTLYVEKANRLTLNYSPMGAGAARWELYPIHAVDALGICTCPNREQCPSPGKHPTTPHGFNDASSDPEAIAAMFARSPGASVGLRTGRGSGVVVLDSDSYEGGGQSIRRLQEKHGRLPGTRLHQTGSSELHYLFAYPEGVDRLPSRTIAPGVELKADGAGVVLPPSNHASGGRYKVLIAGPLAPLPRWVVELASKLTVVEGGGKERHERPAQSRYVLPERIYESSPSRNRTLYLYGCSLRAHGQHHAAILHELRRVNAERCVPPMSDNEVRRIAGSAAGHAPGSASSATPEALEALDGIEAALWARPWPGMGGKSERSVVVALIKAARRHGTLIPAGVRVSIATRQLAEDVGMPQPSLMRVVWRLRRSGVVRKDDADRGPAEAGAFVLLHLCHAATRDRDRDRARARAQCHHSPTPPAPSEEAGSSRDAGPSSDNSSRAPFTAPRLRWMRSLGRTCEAIVDALERAGGEATMEELAKALHAKRPRDLRRRNVPRLEDAGVVECSGHSVRLRLDWIEALEREREANGEKLAERLERKQHEWQREGYRKHLAEERNVGREERA